VTEARPAIRERRRRAGSAHFVRHFAEMVIAMMLGMAVLGGLASVFLALAGSSRDAVEESAPAVVVIGMFVAMTAPMLAWMRHRGHTERALVEMAVAMLVPTAIALALLAAGAASASSALAIEHGAMIAGMLGVMLWRRSEYTQPVSRHRARN
jgi:drug/metabolite transporter (DMT)-like permease